MNRVGAGDHMWTAETQCQLCEECAAKNGTPKGPGSNFCFTVSGLFNGGLYIWNDLPLGLRLGYCFW